MRAPRARLHAKQLEDNHEDEVGCRLVATQLAIGERLNVTQSTQPLVVARLLVAIVPPRVDENEVHAKMEKLVHVHPRRCTCPSGCCLKLHRAMHRTRAASMAWSDEMRYGKALSGHISQAMAKHAHVNRAVKNQSTMSTQWPHERHIAQRWSDDSGSPRTKTSMSSQCTTRSSCQQDPSRACYRRKYH